MTRKLIGYCRVSTDEQAAEGVSLEARGTLPRSGRRWTAAAVARVVDGKVAA